MNKVQLVIEHKELSTELSDSSTGEDRKQEIRTRISDIDFLLVSDKKMDDFFHVEDCQQCGNKLSARIMSWFTVKTICIECSELETKYKKKMVEAGMNPNDYEGCGHIPKIKKGGANGF